MLNDLQIKEMADNLAGQLKSGQNVTYEPFAAAPEAVRISQGDFDKALSIAEAQAFIPVSRQESKTNPGIYQRAKELAAKTGQRIVFVDDAPQEA